MVHLGWQSAFDPFGPTFTDIMDTPFPSPWFALQCIRSACTRQWHHGRHMVGSKAGISAVECVSKTSFGDICQGVFIVFKICSQFGPFLSVRTSGNFGFFVVCSVISWSFWPFRGQLHRFSASSSRPGIPGQFSPLLDMPWQPQPVSMWSQSLPIFVRFWPCDRSRNRLRRAMLSSEVPETHKINAKIIRTHLLWEPD